MPGHARHSMPPAWLKIPAWRQHMATAILLTVRAVMIGFTALAGITLLVFKAVEGRH